MSIMTVVWYSVQAIGYDFSRGTSDDSWYGGRSTDGDPMSKPDSMSKPDPMSIADDSVSKTQTSISVPNTQSWCGNYGSSNHSTMSISSIAQSKSQT